MDRVLKSAGGAPVSAAARLTGAVPRVVALRDGSEALASIIDIYLAEYRGRDGSRFQRLGYWRERLGHLSVATKGRRRFKVTTDSNHDLPISPNLLDREITVAEPDKVWVGDITYIPADEGWLFLAVVIDLFSRQVLGLVAARKHNPRDRYGRAADGMVQAPPEQAVRPDLPQRRR